MLEEVDEAAGVPAVAASGDDLLVELVDERRHGEPGTVALGLVEADAQVLAHPLDGETEVERFAAIVRARLSICQLCAAPLPITSTTSSTSRPARWAKLTPSASPWTTPAMQIWLTIFVSWPEPAGPRHTHDLAYVSITGFVASNTSGSSQPHMTVS